MDLDPHRIASHPIMAGLLGALIGLRFAPGLSAIERIGNVAAGAVAAGYVAPAAAEAFALTSSASQSALAFAVGMFGMSVAAAVMQAIRDLRLAEIISGWISRKGG